jgi:hypothetical protein
LSFFCLLLVRSVIFLIMLFVCVPFLSAGCRVELLEGTGSLLLFGGAAIHVLGVARGDLCCLGSPDIFRFAG